LQGAGRLQAQAQVAVHYLAIVAHQQGDFEALFANGGHHLLHRVVIAPRIAHVWAQGIGSAEFYLHRSFSFTAIVMVVNLFDSSVIVSPISAHRIRAQLQP